MVAWTHFRWCICGAALAAFLLPAPAAVGAKTKYLTGSIYANGTEMIVTQVPREIRDVPVKLWAPSFEGDTLIAGQRYTILPMVSVGLALNKPRLKVGRAQVRLGLRWMLLPYPWSGRTNVRRFTAATTPDGVYYGKVTTSYAIAPRGLLPGWAWRDPIWQATTDEDEGGPGVGMFYWLLNFTPYVEAEAPISTNGRVKLQGSLSYYRLEAMSGWMLQFDPNRASRWTSPDYPSEENPYGQTYRRDTLAHCYPLAIGLKYDRMTLGVRYLMVSPTAIGRRSGLLPRRVTGFVSFGY